MLTHYDTTRAVMTSQYTPTATNQQVFAQVYDGSSLVETTTTGADGTISTIFITDINDFSGTVRVPTPTSTPGSSSVSSSGRRAQIGWTGFIGVTLVLLNSMSL
jgi:hypothetical protein